MLATIHINDLNDIFDEHLGQTYEESLDDERLSRISPEVICSLLHDVLDLAEVKIAGLN